MGSAFINARKQGIRYQSSLLTEQPWMGESSGCGGYLEGKAPKTSSKNLAVLDGKSLDWQIYELYLR